MGNRHSQVPININFRIIDIIALPAIATITKYTKRVPVNLRNRHHRNIAPIRQVDTASHCTVTMISLLLLVCAHPSVAFQLYAMLEMPNSPGACNASGR